MVDRFHFFGPEVMQNIMVERYNRKAASLMAARKQRKGKGPGKSL